MSYSSDELERIKVLVVDDHTLFAEGTVSLLTFEPRILVVGIAKNGIECMSFIRKTKCDAVLLDISLPDTCGTDLINKIKEIQPDVKILMLTGQNPKGYVTKSISKGANGFLLKDCSVQEMIQAILRVYYGGAYFSEGLDACLHSKNSSSDRFPVNAARKRLTPKEIKIMELVAKGLHNKEIAATLEINVRTVEFHVSNILPKLGVNKRLEAVLLWASVNKETL